MRAHYSRLWYDLARALLARDDEGDRERAAGLLEKSRALASELDQAGLVAQIDEIVAPPPSRSSTRLVMCREADVWAIDWNGQTLRLKDSRGLSLLARLVASAGEELHVLQLVADGDEPRDGGDAGPLLDPTAIQEYRRRLLDLREDLEDAERASQDDRAEKAREEIEILTRELARAVGLGGRERRAGQAAERARTAVQKRLREAIRRIEADLPELGRHFDRTIRTGVFCAYLPDRPRSPVE